MVGMVRLFYVFGLALALAGGRGDAQSAYEAPGLSDRQIGSFVAGLQRAVSRDDRRAVAAMVRYPMTVFVARLRVPVGSADEMVERYDAVFTSELKARIADTRAGSEPGSPGRGIRMSADGLTVADGLIVVAAVEGALKITSITVPPGAAPRPPGSSAAPGETVRSPRPRTPQRVNVPPGRASVQRLGALGAGQTDSYVVWARRGQLLEVRVERVRESAIVLHVFDATSRAPVDARARAGVRVWAGRVPATGDFRIDVVRLATSGPSVMTYTLVVGLRQ
jgi:hypothetical protein